MRTVGKFFKVFIAVFAILNLIALFVFEYKLPFMDMLSFINDLLFIYKG